MKLTLILVLAIVSLANTPAVARESRVERDFRVHKKRLEVTENATREEACRYGGWMKVYRAGNEIRKIEFSIGTSNRDVERDIYFSLGKPVLVIEREYWIVDENADLLETRRPPKVKRVWLTERGGTKGQRALRKKLREHAEDLAAIAM
jgi:hypothetical protein